MIVTSLLATACTMDSGVEDGELDDFTSADGKADGYDLTEAEAIAVMHVAAELTEAQLKSEVGLTPRVAKNIATYRAGVDRRRATADDQAFDSLAELDALPYIGPRALELLLAHATEAGILDARDLGRHEVSILVPLPTSGDLPWKASTPGNGGALLPRTVFDKIRLSVVRELADGDAEYDALRVVAVRFDPCFTVSLTSTCQPQIRLVFQTLSADMGTNDGAIHALYNLKATDWDTVVDALRAIDTAPQSKKYAPLGVNPTLAVQGMAGPYARDLQAVITDFAGPATLARMTFMTRTSARQGQWELGGFHVKASAATGFPAAGPIKIVGSETIQIVGNAGFGGFRYTVTPALLDAAGEAGLDASGIPALSAAARTKLASWTTAQESPLETVPDTTDCTSCHIAGHVTNALEAAAPEMISLDRGPRTIAGAERIGDNLRAFGYFGKEPHVSIRTANETAAVLRAFAAQR